MKFIFILILLLSFTNCIYAQDNPQGNANDSVPDNASILINAYPEQHLSFVDNRIVFEDGYSIIYDDGDEKDFIHKLDNSDIEDMFSMKYQTKSIPNYIDDAGRSRCEPFFKKMYGENAKDVKKNLVNVSWFGETVEFTKINGAAEQLKKVASEIQAYPELIPYMKSSGSFYWRKVRGANRLSSHSYGIAIDIAVKQSDYWRWANPKAKETDRIEYKNRIPMKIVEIFEKYGFVWGGRWYHYDMMHFEYRPEIVFLKK